jgi:glycosyltransferase involved in cell wall biosynthesis
MTRLGLVPYRDGDAPQRRTVPVTVIILAKDEALNLIYAIPSCDWAVQVVVIDSGSSDETVAIAHSYGADVVVEAWRGFSAQRAFALTHPIIHSDWVYFLDADEWISAELAAEIDDVVRSPTHDAYRQRRRLVFSGSWIRHCGWYRGSWLTRLLRRDAASFDLNDWVDRPRINGSIGALRNDLVDEDRKGLASWLHKHVGYAELEAERRRARPPFRRVLGDWRGHRRTDTRPLGRAVLKDLVFPWVPAKPLGMFLYMYVVRLGFLDGLTGLRFCFFHAWFQATVNALEDSRRRQARSADGQL